MNPSSTSPARMRSQAWRIAGWSAAALLLLVPLVAMQFTPEVRWSAGDFLVFGLTLAGVGAGLELAARQTADLQYRLAAGVALLSAFLVVWANLAVGIVGEPSHLANGMFFGVLAIGLLGSVLGRGQAPAMAANLLVMASLQALVGLVVLAAELDSAGLVASVVLSLLWLLSALLFRRAARAQA